MRGIIALWDSSIGKKYIMAASGLLLLAWIFLHAVGNLKVFTGPQHFNEYGEFLRVIGAPVLGQSQLLWVIRFVLLLALVLHVTTFVQLWRRDRAARTVRYARYDPQVFSFASRTMRWGGIAVLLFVIYHLLHFTTGDAHPQFRPLDPYHNVVAGFQSPVVAIIYIGAVTALGLHLYHGLWSAFQTLGLNNPRYNRFRRPLALVVAVTITLAFMTVPLAVLAGILTE
ncbi:MAG: succinate dehydrogenase cytochrome b subunit [Longimicrobiales bacterium]